MLAWKIFGTVLLALFSLTTTEVSAETTTYEVAYFYVEACSDCRRVENEGLLDDLRAQGVDVQTYDLRKNENDELFLQYTVAYNTRDSYPILFAGEDVYSGFYDIREGIREGQILSSAESPLLDVDQVNLDDLLNLEGLSGLITIIIAGLIDGINPCAIAMLLMFISMVGFIKDRRALLIVSVTYIGAIFLTYFAIGLFVLGALRNLTAIEVVGRILYILFALLCFFLFLITFQDFLASRKQKYEKVKNQLPSRLKKFNQRLMEKFTKIFEEEDNRLKRYFYVIGIPFLIGVVIAVTEALCTGQIYIVILFSIRTTAPLLGRFYLLVFNLMFIVPLIIIALITVKTKDVMAVSNAVRKRMPLIKLVTSIFFLAMMVYFISQVAGYTLFGFNLLEV